MIQVIIIPALLLIHYTLFKGCCGCDRMIVGFTNIYVISAYNRWGCEFESRSGGRYVLDTALCDKVCQWLATDQWFSPVFSNNKTDHHDITEISVNSCGRGTAFLYMVSRHKSVWLPVDVFIKEMLKTLIRDCQCQLESFANVAIFSQLTLTITNQCFQHFFDKDIDRKSYWLVAGNHV
jgi:hypothetical protein